MNSTSVVIGNVEITKLVTTARTQWASGTKARLELGETFSKLRAAVDKYSRTNKDGDNLSYNEAVRLTGVPRGTAERYRQMFNVCDVNEIPADAFVIIAEAGFNLATDVHEDSTVAAILATHPQVASVEELLALSDEETKKLVAALHKDFGKDEQQTESLSSLQAEIAKMQQSKSESKDVAFKKYLDEQINKQTTTVRNKMLWAIRNIAIALAPFLDKDADWVETYTSQFKQDGKVTVLVEQVYKEATKFAQSASFLTPKKPSAGAKKPASSVKKQA